MKFDNVFESSPILTAIKSNNTTPCETNFTLESLRCMQGPGYEENI